MPQNKTKSRRSELPRTIEVVDLTRDQKHEIARTRLFRAASVFAAGILCVAAGAIAGAIVKKRR